MLLCPRILKRVFLHYELDDVRGDFLAVYIVPALAVCPRGIRRGGGMHADVEDEGVCVLGVGKRKSQFCACGGVPRIGGLTIVTRESPETQTVSNQPQHRFLSSSPLPPYALSILMHSLHYLCIVASN